MICTYSEVRECCGCMECQSHHEEDYEEEYEEEYEENEEDYYV